MDIFIEPVLPRPVLATLGSSPVAQALAGLAAQFGFIVPAEDGLGPAAPAFVVVSTRGNGDERALRAA